jgi:transaldolase
MGKENPLLKLRPFGQSVWLDGIRRGMFASGELSRMIEEDGLAGVIFNPLIFEEAIADTAEYDNVIRALSLQGRSAKEMYRTLTIEDAQRAADLFRPLYDRQEGRDGFVSLAVNSRLAHDTHGTVSEARRLWALLDRPNVLIEVPATSEGLPAIRKLIRKGINVSGTLIFGLSGYRKVAEAYIAGLEERVADGQAVGRVASVAGFFLNRIDKLVDSLLEEKGREGGMKGEIAKTLRGQAAVASAKAAYQIYEEIFLTEKFRRLAVRGALTQRLLWASTHTKDPEYSDVMYVEALIGPDTVAAICLETLKAYGDHGRASVAGLVENLGEARKILELLPEMGVDLDAVARQLEEEGVQSLVESFEDIEGAIERKRKKSPEKSPHR